jgi:phospholipid transport system substrate-binding protein
MASCFRLLAGAALAFALSTASAQLRVPVAPGPDALMSALTAEVMTTLREDKAAGRKTDLAQLVEARIVPVFDFTRMTSLALARNWRLASPEQRAALIAKFQLLLVRTYSLVLLEFRDQAIDFKPLRAQPGESEVTVRSSLRRSGVEPLSIDYEMADGPGGWKVFDVKVAGVSLVLTYRDSFAQAVRTGGIDGLIKALEERNRQNLSGSSEAAKLAPVLMIYGGSAAKP